MAEPSRLSVRVRIHGKVQGVWFRAWTVREAAALGLSGWVRNRSDGTVEAVFAGDATEVRAMVARCRAGPPAAEVGRVEETLETEPVGSGFRQRPTR
jgi:acylphosphatase